MKAELFDKQLGEFPGYNSLVDGLQGFVAFCGHTLLYSITRSRSQEAFLGREFNFHISAQHCGSMTDMTSYGAGLKKLDPSDSNFVSVFLSVTVHVPATHID